MSENSMHYPQRECDVPFSRWVTVRVLETLSAEDGQIKCAGVPITIGRWSQNKAMNYVAPSVCVDRGVRKRPWKIFAPLIHWFARRSDWPMSVVITRQKGRSSRVTLGAGVELIIYNPVVNDLNVDEIIYPFKLIEDRR